MTKIKLCGLSRECDIEYANELLPEYIGFVFAPKSSRYVDFDKAMKLKRLLDNRIMAVGVFVNANITNIKRLVDSDIIDAVQLHGDEDNRFVDELKKEVNCPIIKAFKIETESDVCIATQSNADFIMLDSGGGTGKAFDHSVLAKIERPFFLAGGLTDANVHDAIAKYHPYAVDTSSFLETDGHKDKNKMLAFVNAVRD